MDSLQPCELHDHFNAALTITLDELIAKEVFNWNRPALAGCFDDLGEDVATRLKAMFIERYLYREICMVPPGRWMQRLGYEIRYELVPKFKPLYDALENGDYSPLNDENEYYKARNIDSDFPETLLAQNQVYASFGTDREYQRIKTKNGIEAAVEYETAYRNVDTMFIDALGGMFTDLWTLNYNGF